MHLSDPREFPRYATARTIDDPPYTFLFNSENSFSGELFLLKNPPILVVSYERKFIRYANRRDRAVLIDPQMSRLTNL